MDLTTGIFTAPRTGIYFFSFTALVDFPISSILVDFGVSLYLNGNRIANGYVEEGNNVVVSADGQNEQVTFQSTLKLKNDDRVWVQIDRADAEVSSTLYDDNFPRTHFNGFMLEEEIVASL
jgi:hypothetical protein